MNVINEEGMKASIGGAEKGGTMINKEGMKAGMVGVPRGNKDKKGKFLMALRGEKGT